MKAPFTAQSKYPPSGQLKGAPVQIVVGGLRIFWIGMARKARKRDFLLSFSDMTVKSELFFPLQSTMPEVNLF